MGVLSVEVNNNNNSNNVYIILSLLQKKERCWLYLCGYVKINLGSVKI